MATAVPEPGVPPYDFLNLYFESMVFSTAGYARVFPEKRLELKSLKGQMKAEELEAPRPELLSLCRSLKAL
jgi:hypothetical protein